MSRRVYTYEEYIGLVMESGQVFGVCPGLLKVHLWMKIFDVLQLILAVSVSFSFRIYS